MSRYSGMFVCIVLMMCFGIFFGIELATKGMERIHGPAPASVQPGAAVQPQPVTQAPPPAAGNGQTPVSAKGQGGENAATAAQPKPQPQPLTTDSGVNRVGNQIGDMLQSVAHGTIRTVVSLLDSIVN
ncbi:hypothetical protein [Paenibacillus sp. GCM10012303]|uniref:hypothetical protein n=1 Tax=Paenibacillus sp. GCM10012303 TaxID=3317340 RepID=UPI00360B7BBD